MKYNVTCNGARISANSMISVAKIIAGTSRDVREVYKNIVGRYPTAHQMEMI